MFEFADLICDELTCFFDDTACVELGALPLICRPIFGLHSKDIEFMHNRGKFISTFLAVGLIVFDAP